MRKGYSYARFSTREQANGYSLQRQLEAAESYCRRNGLALDDRPFHDKGVSGYHGSNATAGELAEFIGLVKSGAIPRGSVLIVENTDRLSRLPPDEANRIITTIVRAGVDIVTTSPEQVYTAGNIDKLATWLPLQVSNCLAREESVKKSDRLKDAWKRKRDALAAGVKVSKKGPFWLKLTADRRSWIVLEEEADLMRRVFRWADEGEGAARICERLNRERPEGLTGRGWQPANVRKLLRWRAAIGEFQPFIGTCARKGGVKSTRRPCGEPVRDYFPPIIGEAEFYRAQAALDGRRRGGGRAKGAPNLFKGILYDALDGRKMVLNSDRRGRVLVSGGAIRNLQGSSFRSMLYDGFERAILSQLRELRPEDVTGTPTKKQDEVDTLAGKLAALNHNIARTQQRAAGADDPSVFLDLLETYGKQRIELTDRLEHAKAEAAVRDGNGLGECQSLLALLDKAKGAEREDLRRQAAAALGRLVQGIWVAIVRRGHHRIIAAQVWFRGGAAHRDYFMPVLRGEWPDAPVSGWSAAIPGELDLRKPAHAARLERALEKIDPAVLSRAGAAAVE